MSPILNHTDSLLVTSNLRHANLTKLMDEVRQKDCFLLRPPPSKLSGAADTYANAMLIDLWMMIPADGREYQWLSFFEANPEIVQVTSTVEDFLTEYHAQTQDTPLTQPGAFATANTVSPEGNGPSKKRKRDGTSGDDNDEDHTDASQHRSSTSRVPVIIDPALLEEDEQRELARKARCRNPQAPTGQAHIANIRRTATTSTSSASKPGKGRTKGARPPSDEDPDVGTLGDDDDDDDPPVPSARARRRAKNDAVSAKKAMSQLQAEAEDARARKQRCLSMLGPKKGGGWTPEQLELDTHISATVRQKSDRLCGFSKTEPLPKPLDSPVDRQGKPCLPYDFINDVDYHENRDTIQQIADSIWQDEKAEPILKAAGQPYFTFLHLLKHVKEYFRNLRSRYEKENNPSKQRKANKKNQVARHTNRQQTLAKNRLSAVPFLCEEYPELDGVAVNLVIKADWMSDAWSGPDWDSDDEHRQRKRKDWLQGLGADVDRRTKRPSARFYRNKNIWEVLEQPWRSKEYNWVIRKLDEYIELGRVEVANSTERVRVLKEGTQAGDLLGHQTMRWPETAPPASLIQMKVLPQHPDPDAERFKQWGEWDNPQVAGLVESVEEIMVEEAAERQRREDDAAVEAVAAEAKRKEKARRKLQRSDERRDRQDNADE